MKFSQALPVALAEQAEAVVTSYRLGLTIYKLFAAKEFGGSAIAGIKNERATAAHFFHYAKKLVAEGVLIAVPEYGNSIFRLLGRREESLEEIVCSIDPFCFVSHLSAMAYHGLTDRIPDGLFVTSMPSREWQTEALKKMRAELGSELEAYLEAGMPALTKTSVKKPSRPAVREITSVVPGSFLKIADRNLRVSKIGHVFLEMLRRPDLCGGLRHVIEVYENYAGRYTHLIVGEIDRNGDPIDKVRAGYILEERLGIENETVETWARLAQRGGSRKLDAKASYFPEWSDKWKISLNLR